MRGRQKRRYEELSEDPTSKIINKITYRIRKSKADKNLKRELQGYHGVAPRVMGQVKVHKAKKPMRFIFTMCGSPVANLSRYLTRIIWPLLKNYPRIARYAPEIAKLIRQTDSRQKIWVSFDVVALFPSVPIDETITLLCDKFRSNSDILDSLPFELEEIKQFLEICLKHGNYFKDLGKIWKMRDMGPIGNPLMVVAAECFLQHFEEVHMSDMNLQNFDLKLKEFWKHYVDDVLDSAPLNFNVEKYIEYMNSFHPRIKFTSEVQDIVFPAPDAQFQFLDIKIVMDSEPN